MSWTAVGLLSLMSIVWPAGASADLKLDVPPNVNQKPYHPADGSSPTTNPPPFVWVPVKGAATYSVHVAKSEAFSGDGVRSVEGIAWSVYVPTEPLEAGRWFWRYGAADKQGKVHWSKTRAFTVTDEAKVFPAPDVDELIGKIAEDRPRLFIPRRELDAVRQRTNKALPDVIKSLKRGSDRCIGVDLVAEPEPVTRKKGPFRGKHYRDIFVRTRPPMDRMETCGLAYLLTGEKKYGLEAKRRILHFFSWDPKGTTSYRSNDEPAMWVMMRGTRGYDWTYDLFTPAEREKVEACMRIRAQQFFDYLRSRHFASNPHNSHANRTLGFLGEAALSFAHEWPEAKEWLRYVTQVYWGIFPAWGEADGGWQEGPGYWNAYMSFAMYFITALHEISGVNLAEKPFFQNTPYYALYTNPPYAGHSPFGDGQSGRPGKRRGNLLYWFSTLTRDPYVRWYPEAQQSGPGGNVLGVVLYDPSLKPKRPADLPQARLFEGVGLVAMHSALGDAKNDAYLLMRSSPYGGISHGHANQNAIVVEAFGEPLAIASGYYPWYSSPHHHQWTRQTKASCAITIDGGLGQKPRDRHANGRITQFATGVGYDLAVGDATAAYAGRLKRALRKVIHVSPGVFVVFDDVVAPKPVTFEWRLHSKSQMLLDNATRRALVRQGKSMMDVRMLAPKTVRWSQTDEFDPPPEDRGDKRQWSKQWHAMAATVEKTPATQFLTVLWPWKDKAPAPAAVKPISQAGLLGCEVHHGGRNVVVFRVADQTQGSITVGDVKTDAVSFAVRYDPSGKPRQAVVESATVLEIGGEGVLKSKEPVTQVLTVK